MKKIKRSVNLVVQKYGGTSVADPEKIKKIAAYAKNYYEKSIKLIIVVSAMGKETDHLINTAGQISSNPDPREFDQLLQTGEIKPAALLAMALKDIGVPAKSYTAAQVGLTTSRDYNSAKIKNIKHKKRIIREAKEKVLVVTGFQGLAEGSDDITTLGRGGSDATAVAIAEQLNADICEIYTDVDGVYAIDPRIVDKARRFDKISYMQMRILATAGTEILMDRCVKIAQDHNVPIRVMLSPSLGKSTGGTMVASMGNPANIEEDNYLTGMAIRRNVGIVNLSNIPNVPGSAEKIFEVLENINVIDAVQGQGGKTASMSILLDEKVIGKVSEKFTALSKIKVEPRNKLVSLTLVDPKMKNIPRFFLRLSRSMKAKGINIEMIFSSLISIGIAIGSNKLEKAAQALAEEFGMID